jgi:hypothetical protein
MRVRIDINEQEQRVAIRLINKGNEDLRKFTKREFGKLQSKHLRMPFQMFEL